MIFFVKVNESIVVYWVRVLDKRSFAKKPLLCRRNP